MVTVCKVSADHNYLFALEISFPSMEGATYELAEPEEVVNTVCRAGDKPNELTAQSLRHSISHLYMLIYNSILLLPEPQS
jgi:hypothetical protein